MSLLLDLVDGTVLEGPLEDIGLGAGAGGDGLGLVESGPELAEVLQLDEVPDLGERRVDDDALEDGGGGGDDGRHVGCCGCLLLVFVLVSLRSLHLERFFEMVQVVLVMFSEVEMRSCLASQVGTTSAHVMFLTLMRSFFPLLLQRMQVSLTCSL